MSKKGAESLIIGDEGLGFRQGLFCGDGAAAADLEIFFFFEVDLFLSSQPVASSSPSSGQAFYAPPMLLCPGYISPSDNPRSVF